jgi:putative DNA primase/helicase
VKGKPIMATIINFPDKNKPSVSGTEEPHARPGECDPEDFGSDQQSSPEEMSLDIGYTIAMYLLAARSECCAFIQLTESGAFYEYTGTHWVPLSEVRLRGELQQIAKHLKAQSKKTLVSMVSDALSALRDYLGSEPILAMDEARPMMINCLNGELWFSADGEVELRAHMPESQQLSCLPYAYDPSATCPVFDQTLLEIFAQAKDPGEMVRHASELLGYAIQPSRPFPCFWLLIGHGANGKSKFMETLTKLVGTDHMHNVEMASFGKDRFSLSQLPGKLVMLDDDIKMDTRLPDGLLKKISESKLLTVRQPYGKQSFTFLSTALPIMVGNHYPQCSDLSEGLVRRAMVLPFQRQFAKAEQDPAKFEYIWKHEMPGVLNRAIAGYQRVMQRQGFQPPVECVEAQKDFLAHSNPLYCFIMECVEEKTGSRILLKEFRATYEIWAKQQKVSSLRRLDKTLKRQLESLGFNVGTHNGYGCIQGGMLVNVV